jgi:hypothetical protein
MGEGSALGRSENDAPFTSAEVHRLRELARTPPTPWWKNYALLIAGAGFLLSLITALISAYVGHRKDVHGGMVRTSLWSSVAHPPSPGIEGVRDGEANRS